MLNSGVRFHPHKKYIGWMELQSVLFDAKDQIIKTVKIYNWLR